MKRKITFLIAACLLLSLIVQPIMTNGQDATFSFTSNTNPWGLPTDSYTTGTTSYTNSGTNQTITMHSGTGNNDGWKFNNSNGIYLIYGQSGAYLQLPAFAFPVKKIEVVGRSGASSKTKQNIYVGTTAVSTETTGVTGTNTYNINSNYQTEGNLYRIQVTSAHKTQITTINVYKACSVTYDKNDNNAIGTVTDANSPYASGSIVTVKENSFTNAGYNFTGWNTTPGGTGTAYAPGATFTISANTTLYAQWESAGNYITISPTTKIVDSEGGAQEFTIDTDQEISTTTNAAVQFYSNVAGTAQYEANKPSWITSTAYSTATNKLTVTVAANHTASANGPAYFRVKNTNGTVTSDVVTISQAAFVTESPTFNPESGTIIINEDIVMLESETDGATIYYTMGDNPSDPTTSSAVYDPNNGIVVDESTTIKAIAVKYDISSAVSTASYTVVNPLTTMEAIFAAATTAGSTAADCYITFNDWVIVAALDNSAYLTDGQYGLQIYKSGGLGFLAGDHLTGTVACKVKLYDSGAELINLTNTTQGLTVTSSTIGSPYAISVADLTGAYMGSYVDLGNLTYDGNYSTFDLDNENWVEYENTFEVSGLPSLTDGHVYRVKGVCIYYTYSQKIYCKVAPIASTDIVEFVEPVVTVDPTTASAFSYIVGGGPSEEQLFTVTGSNLTSDDITVSVPADCAFEITDDEEYGNSVTIASGDVISVRMKAGNPVGEYEATLTIENDGAEDVEINLSGSVTKASVTYSGNAEGVTNVPTDNSEYSYNDEVTVLGKGDMARTGYDFLYWTPTQDGSGIVAYEGGEKFNITANTTLYAQWDALTFDITKSSMTHGSVTVKVGGSEVTEATTGSTVTLTIAPDSGYALGNLTVIRDDNQQNVTVNNNAFTMPGSNVTVSATFIAVVTDVLTGPTIGNKSSSYNDWSNKTWTSPAVYKGNTSGNNTYGWRIQFRSSNSSGIVTTTSGGKVKMISVTWSSNPSNTNGRSIDIYGKNTAYSGPGDLYNDNNKGTLIGSITYSTGVYSGVLYVSGDYDHIGLRAHDGAIYFEDISISWAPSYTVSYDANAEGATGTTTDANKYAEGATVTAKANGFTHPSSYTFNSWNSAADGSGTTYAPAATFTMGTANVTLYAQWNRNDLPVNVLTHELESSTTVNEGEVVTVSSEIIIPNGITLTVDGTLVNTTAANLIIEDGGQLIVNNAGVQAAVKKSVATWSGSLAKGTNPGWQTISTSTRDAEDGSTIAFSNVDNLVYLDNTTPRYNVYAYDEANILWVNNLASAPYGFSTLKVGQGYIYRTGGSTDLEYKGYVNTGDIDVILAYGCGTSSFKGFNLIGNPYTHTIYKGTAVSAIPNGSLLEEGYYALNLETGMFTVTDDGTAIPRGTAIMVQAKDQGGDYDPANYTLTMANSTSGASGSKAGNDNIWFSVKNENFQDFACVKFKPGRGLNKIDHQNENAPMLYINHNGENFGSVNMSDDTKSINLNFKAMTMGKYTLSLKPEGNFSYIHVIDKLTGEDIDMLLEGEYSFIASPSDADNRFIVKLGYQPDYGNDNDIFAYQSGSEIYVTGNGELQIFDVTGRRVMTTTINGAESISIPAQGVYIFRLNEKVQKIVVR